LIAGRFVPLETAAPGGPLRCRDQQTAQTVVLMPAPGVDRRLAGLFHPNLLAVFAIVEHEGTTLAACEFVPGRPLAVVLGGGRCHPKRAKEIVAGVANGVADLHAHAMCHGAITIDSVIVTDKGKAKLTLLDAVAGGTEAADVMALRRLLSSIAAGPVAAIQTESAAVLAAALRA
jgi:tRNA A-37 threonylcarbamoyl transferase component Bud32